MTVYYYLITTTESKYYSVVIHKPHSCGVWYVVYPDGKITKTGFNWAGTV